MLKEVKIPRCADKEDMDGYHQSSLVRSKRRDGREGRGVVSREEGPVGTWRAGAVADTARVAGEAALDARGQVGPGDLMVWAVEEVVVRDLVVVLVAGDTVVVVRSYPSAWPAGWGFEADGEAGVLSVDGGYAGLDFVGESRGWHIRPVVVVVCSVV